MSFGGEEHYWRRDTGELSVKRRKQNLSTYSRPPPQHDLFDADPFDSELREDLEESAGDWPGPSMPSERYIPVKTGSHSGIEVRHVDITSEDPFGTREKLEEKSKKSKKGGSKMKSTFDDIALDELRHYRRLSGNTLWSLVQKRKMGLTAPSAGEDSSGLNSAAPSTPGGTSTAGSPNTTGVNSTDKAMNKRLQQLWGCLPEKERRLWKSKAKRIMKQLQCIQRKEASAAAAGKQVSPEVARQKERQRVTQKLASLRTSSVTTADLAAHLKLIGDGLLAMGHNLTIQTTPLMVSGVDSVLLDSLLCSLPPLLQLCCELPGLQGACDREEVCETLDSLTHLMPGLY